MKALKTMSLALALILSSLLLGGCKENALNLQYNVTIVGDAEGDVAVTFPEGTLDLNGTASLNFRYGNAEPAAKIANISDKEFRAIAEKVYAEVDDAFSAVSASGTYYLRVTGYCIESTTGVKISIDKTLTNRE